MSELIMPGTFKPASQPNAQLSTKIVFYRSAKLGRIMMGAPEQYPAPPGWEKIVCNAAHEAEMWSERLRQQDKREQEMTDYERELVEGPIRDYARKELQHKMANARNAVNRDFCRYALERLEDREAKGKVIRESYLHAEAFEKGH